MADCKIVAPYRNLYMPPWPEWSSKELLSLQIRSAYHFASPSLHLSYSVCFAAVYSKQLNGRGISKVVIYNSIKN